MKRLLTVCLILALVLGCSGCSSPTESTVFCMDTVMHIRLWGTDTQRGLESVTQLLSELEKSWSVTVSDSYLSRLSRGEAVSLDADAQALLQKAQALAERTGGAFDPRLGGLSQVWGFYDENYTVPSQEQIREAIALKQWDLGGALKGYAGTKCIEILKQLKIDRAMLDLGGNIQTYGKKPDGTPWQIGIRNPDGGDPVGMIAVEGTAAVVTAGNYQRYFELEGVRYHHIMDPETGYPANSGLRSVTVICQDGMTADALSTALLVMGLEEGSAHWRESDDFEAVFITSRGKIYATEGVALSGCEFEVICREN